MNPETDNSSKGARRLGWLVLIALAVILMLLLAIWHLNQQEKAAPPPAASSRQTLQPESLKKSYGDRYYFAGMPIATTNYQDRLLVLTNIGYVVGYSEQRHDPKWVCYRLFAVNNLKAPPRPQGFSVDGRTRSRIASADYTGSKFDRGHCAPNYAIAVCYGAAAQLETFYMSNILPERPSLNRQVWERLEQKEIKEYAQEFQEIWVTTGPVFGTHDGHLRHGVDVPEACYKIIVDEENGRVRVLAFIIPQTVTGNEDAARFLTSVDEVEKETGLDFMSDLPDEVENRVEAEKAERMW